MKTKKLLFLIGALLLVICGVVFLYLKTSVMSTEEAIKTLREYDRQHVVVDPESGKNIKIINKELLDHFKRYQEGKEDITDYPYIDTIIKRYTKKTLVAREIDEAKSKTDKTSQKDENKSHHRLLVRCLVSFATQGCTIWNFFKCCDDISEVNDSELMAFVCTKGIADKPHLINAKNKYGCTPLMYVAQCSTVEACKALIAAGADVNAKDKDGKTPLMNAVSYSTAEVCKALIEAGADVNAKDKNGWTSLMNASTAEVCKVLIEAGADVNAKEKKGWTPLMCCAGTAEVCKVLIEAGANVNAKDKIGKTPLMHAETAEVCKALIEAGADVNAKDKNGDTPLMHAAISGFSTAEVCKALIEAGADVNAKNNFGRTPLMRAAEWSTAEVCKVLIEAGATDQ